MKQLAWLVFLAAVAFAASPFFTSGFAGFEPGQYPVPQDDPPVQPEGWAFSIWGLIYLWLIVGTGFGALFRPEWREWDLHRLSLLISLIAGVFWIPLANMSVLGATALIWLMLMFALLALLLTGREDRFWQAEPIGLYAGWLTAAASVSVGLVLAGFGLLDETPAALVGLAIALVVGLVVQRQRPGVLAYPAALIWALSGIVARNMTPVNLPVLGLALVGIVLFGLAAWWPARRDAQTGEAPR